MSNSIRAGNKSAANNIKSQKQKTQQKDYLKIGFGL